MIDFLYPTKITYFNINFLAFEYKILLMEHIVIAGKSILLSSYRGLSKTICIDEYENVSHEANKWTIIVTIATTINAAHINLRKRKVAEYGTTLKSLIFNFFYRNSEILSLYYVYLADRWVLCNRQSLHHRIYNIVVNTINIKHISIIILCDN